MWNKIRNPPYTSRMQNGMTGYIAAGYQNQVGAETHIISAVCKQPIPHSQSHISHLLTPRPAVSSVASADGVLALSTYVLAYILPQLRNQAKQRLGVYVWTGIQIVMLGTLMNIFRLKQPGCKSSNPFGDLEARACKPAGGGRPRWGMWGIARSAG